MDCKDKCHWLKRFFCVIACKDVSCRLAQVDEELEAANDQIKR